MPHRRHSSHRLAPRHKHSLYAAGIISLLSGLGWLPIHYLLGAGAGELPHPLEPWAMRLHGLAAWIGLFMLGVVTAVHLPRGWHVWRRGSLLDQRNSGILLCLLAALLASSGYALYYFAPESVRPALGWAHAGVGTAMALLLVWHRRCARQGRSAA